MGLVCILQKKNSENLPDYILLLREMQICNIEQGILGTPWWGGEGYNMQISVGHSTLSTAHNKTDLQCYSSQLIPAMSLMMYSESRVYSASVREALNARFVARRMNAAPLRSPALYSGRRSGRQSQ